RSIPTLLTPSPPRPSSDLGRTHFAQIGAAAHCRLRFAAPPASANRSNCLDDIPGPKPPGNSVLSTDRLEGDLLSHQSQHRHNGRDRKSTRLNSSHVSNSYA